jgi:UDP-2,3-diacylglucosamine pyrophosphatase LpxH
MNFLNRITKVFNSSEEVIFDDSSKFIIMSDCHRGDGNWYDSFAKNQNIYFAALNHYYDEGYTYIELGDGDELWEVPKIKEIIREHSDVFWLISRFYKEKRFYMLYGNHDMVKKNEEYVINNLYTYYSERLDRDIALFKDIKVHEGLILKYKRTSDKIFLIHGHQVDLLNYDLWLLSRFLVRYLWTPLELLGVNDITRTAKNYKKRYTVAKKLTEWIIKERKMLIAGHNHRPAFPKVGTPPYFNDGSSVHPRCITGIEIVNGSIMLIKWSVKANKSGKLQIARDVLAGPRKLEDYFLLLH